MDVLLQASYHLQAEGPQERSHAILLFSGRFCATLMKWEASDILATAALEQES